VIARGRVLKGQTAPEQTVLEQRGARAGRIVPARVVEATERALAIHERAVAEAEQLRAQTERELGDLKARAVEAGRAEGLAQVVAELARVQGWVAQFELRSQERIVTIARLLAERIVGNALSTTPSLVADMASSVLEELRGARQVRLFAHPQDHALIAQRLAPMHDPSRSIVLESDAQLARGELRVTTEIGSFEAKIGQRLDVLCERLKSPA
jgi:flagellar biosynthesis/type III secretory pathway protein FliH